MLTFSQYLKETVFQTREVPVAKGKMAIRTHSQEVAGQNVGISINTMLPNYSRTREHTIAFSVNGEADRGDVPAQSGRAVWSHVGRVLHGFHSENIEKRPGTHVYRVSAEDADEAVKGKKHRVYGKMMQTFARRAGGVYSLDGDSHVVKVGNDE